MAFNVKTFTTRATTAFVFVAVLVSCVWYNYTSFVLFFALVGFIGLYEFFKLSKNLGASPNKVIGYLLHIISVAITLCYQFINASGYFKILPYVFILLVFTSFIIELFSQSASLNNIAYMLLASLYVTLPCCLLISMVSSPSEIGPLFQPQKVLGMIFFIWINDTGAYLVGSFFGKHKLYEKISPNKTWEGTLGGIALCIALSFVIAAIFPQLTQMHWLVISLIVAIFGNIGDLVESMLKRMAGVKDSGNLMPGHGGVLDRFDSLFFTAPFVAAYLALIGLL